MMGCPGCGAPDDQGCRKGCPEVRPVALERKWPVPEPIRTIILSAPERLLGADMIEIRVQLTPLRYWSADGSSDEETRLRPYGDKVYSEFRVHRVEARDSRVLFLLVRQMIAELVRVYLGVEF